MATAMSPKEFRGLMQRFYLTATKVLVDGDAAIDKMMGDGVIGLFFPDLGEDDYRLRAARSGIALLEAVGHGTRNGPWLPIGVGVHAGKAFVGSLGAEGGAYEFAALGETMNVGARLVAAAGEGEIIFSEAVWPQIEAEVTAERTMLDLKGVDVPMPAYLRRNVAAA
jgi:adenylate cyclase